MQYYIFKNTSFNFFKLWFLQIKFMRKDFKKIKQTIENPEAVSISRWQQFFKKRMSDSQKRKKVHYSIALLKLMTFYVQVKFVLNNFSSLLLFHPFVSLISPFKQICICGIGRNFLQPYILINYHNCHGFNRNLERNDLLKMLITSSFSTTNYSTLSDLTF